MRENMGGFLNSSDAKYSAINPIPALFDALHNCIFLSEIEFPLLGSSIKGKFSSRAKLDEPIHENENPSAEPRNPRLFSQGSEFVFLLKSILCDP
jgi:hypothetical protein